jgi:hypothetical protein
MDGENGYKMTRWGQRGKIGRERNIQEERVRQEETRKEAR